MAKPRIVILGAGLGGAIASPGAARKPRRAAGKKAGGAASGDAVTSPMQGTIVKIAVSDGDLYMNLSYSAGRICDDIIDSESRKAACLEEMRVGLLALADVVLEAAGH